MAELKQVILIRKDLDLSRGKIAAQVAHASMAVFFNKMKEVPGGKFLRLTRHERSCSKGKDEDGSKHLDHVGSPEEERA